MSLLGGRYELVSRLGEGGFGSVWLGRDQRMRRDVAVKVLHVTGADTARFEREAQALAQLNHVNIVTAYDYGVDGDQAYLVLELLRGQSLAQELATAGAGGLPVPRVLAILDQILDGLATAHAAGFVHRDLKPHNVMLVNNGARLKIVDFGIAYSADWSRMTSTGGFFGTLPYIAPEQLTGEAVDGRADLYSLGCMTHELLTGRSPFHVETPARWMYAHQFEVPARVGAARPGLPVELDNLVAAMLAKSPNDRPANADEARRLVLAAMAGSASPAMAPAVAAVVVGAAVPPANAESAPAVAAVPPANAESVPAVGAAADPPDSSSRVRRSGLRSRRIVLGAVALLLVGGATAGLIAWRDAANSPPALSIGECVTVDGLPAGCTDAAAKWRVVDRFARSAFPDMATRERLCEQWVPGATSWDRGHVYCYTAIRP